MKRIVSSLSVTFVMMVALIQEAKAEGCRKRLLGDLAGFLSDQNLRIGIRGDTGNEKIMVKPLQGQAVFPNLKIRVSNAVTSTPNVPAESYVLAPLLANRTITYDPDLQRYQADFDDIIDAVVALDGEPVFIEAVQQVSIAGQTFLTPLTNVIRLYCKQ